MFKLGDKVIHMDYLDTAVVVTESAWLKSNSRYFSPPSGNCVYIKWDHTNYVTAIVAEHAENCLRLLTPLEQAML